MQLNDEWILLHNSEENFLEIAIGSKDNYLINSQELLENFKGGKE